MLRGETDLLLRLPQGRLPGGLPRLRPTAGKGHLAGRAAQGVGAAGEQHAQPLRPRDQPGQHRRRRQLPRRPHGIAGVEILVGAGTVGGQIVPVQRMQPGPQMGLQHLEGGVGTDPQDSAPTGPMGNQAPWEVTPYCGPSAVSRTVAISASS